MQVENTGRGANGDIVQGLDYKGVWISPWGPAL